MTTREALAAVREAARTAAAAGDLSSFLAELDFIRSEALLAAASARSRPALVAKTPSRVLTVKEAAERLGRSCSWIYRHKAILPVTRFPTGGFGFDERVLERWIEGRTKTGIA